MQHDITFDSAPAPATPYSPCLAVDGSLLRSGRGGSDDRTGKLISDDLAEHSDRAFRTIDALSAVAGATLGDLVSCLAHLTHPAHFPASNETDERQLAGILPVRTTVRANLVARMRVETTTAAKAG